MPLGSITNAPLSGIGAEPEEVKKLTMIAIKMITNNVFKTKLRDYCSDPGKNAFRFSAGHDSSFVDGEFILSSSIDEIVNKREFDE